MIIIDNLHKTLENRKILKGINLSIAENECVGLIGPNGAGKTTLIKCMTGILSYENGSIRMDSQPIEQHKKDIGYLSQYTDFKAWMTCRESLLFFGQLSGLEKKLVQKRIPTLLEEVGLFGKDHFKVEQLSGGMKQRLGVAQAILHNPRLLILDEPMSSLDPIGRNEMKKLMERLKLHTTILISTHILDDTGEICDRYIIMKNGQVIGNINSRLQHVDRRKVLLQVKDMKNIDRLKMHSDFESVQFLSPHTILLSGDKEFVLKNVIKACTAQSIEVITIGFHQKDLEQVFIEMVSEI
ncbi:ABC transporter ATP-binding protein [Exiguobacterium sp. RIT452]|uniref:ABC transporter ATP-binding protein n=1 Tax=Exiguobacterium sp. RIT452 TaxID=2315552 RepID=UPI000E76BAA9|nr:ABC transporter ATP-binding protein [Exiguobacterium sp. RIT452]RJP02675.1 ABC transporter ATP-binding protein [Exiguobacterium sp. RIT452]